MSAMQHEQSGLGHEQGATQSGPPDEEHGGPAGRSGDETLLAGTPVVVRRAAGLSAVIGAGASAIAIAYLWRAVETGSALDWALCAATSLIAGFYLAGLLDARTPLVVADDLGVRIRLGRQWRGLPWEAVGAVEVRSRRSWLHDGRLVFRPHSLGRALDGLEVRGRRAAALNQKLYGGALAVPLGLTTRTSTPTGDAEAIVEGLVTLSRGRSPVLLVEPEPKAEPDTEARSTTEADPDRDGSATAPTVGAQAATSELEHADRDRREDTVRGPRTLARSGSGSAGRAARLWGSLVRPGTRPPAVPAEPTAESMAESMAESTVETRAAPRTEPGAPAQQPAGAVTDAGITDAVTTGVGAAETAGGATVAEPAPARRSLLGGLGTIVSRVAKGTRRDVDHDPAQDAVDDAEDGALVGAAGGTGSDADLHAAPDADLGDGTDGALEPGAAGADPADGDTRTEPAAARTASPVSPLRSARPALRAEVTRTTPATTLGAPALGAAALHDDGTGRRAGLPEGRELRRPGSVDLEFESPGSGSVRPIATLGDAVEPLVIDDFVTEPAYDPVIGPDLAAARTRVGLTVDELAERTRIRPHVIESIEVDDFAPCGGDFYARGHLRTLARVLGQDPEPLLQKFDDRYATAPINARRVFEAELATGMTGSMRSTVGGPNWGLLVGAVLSLVLVWGLVRLFATEPPELIQSPTPVLNGSAGVGETYPQAVPAAKRPLPVAVVASAGSRVVVRNGEGRIVWAGRLDAGERKAVRVAPPVRVQASNAGAVEVRVSGDRRGTVGEPGEPGRRTFTRSAR